MHSYPQNAGDELSNGMSGRPRWLNSKSAADKESNKL